MTTDTLAVIARRYACRAYQDTPVPADLLRTIAEAGVRAPSAVNRQPWRLVVVSDKTVMGDIETQGLENLRAADETGYARIQSRGGRLLYGAPAMIIVATQAVESPFPVALDAGIVVSHVALAATALGLDTCVAAFPGQALQPGSPLAAKVLPAGFDFAISVLLGYAATPGGTPHEPDFAKISYV
ncbi:MAG: nitroreductase family protein [Propionibacteriaceae bacterium]|jgi:nitroreductase|nr:nitroreductase family protein [Propionibacteriaceae bacterium]